MAKPGYGYAHAKARAQAIAVMVPGTPCPFCHKPMTSLMSLDYDHTIPVAMGGIDSPKRLSHSHCNRSQGARMGNRMRRAKYVKRPKVLRKGTTNKGTAAINRRLPKW